MTVQPIEIVSDIQPTFTCDSCGLDFEGLSYYFGGGEEVCESCFDVADTCHRCGITEGPDRISGRNRDGQPICVLCGANEYSYCSNCDVLVRDHYFDSHFDMCQTCVAEIASACDGCGEMVENDWLVFRGGNCYCDSCQYDARPVGIHGYHDGHPMGMKFHGEGRTFFGIEFEMAGDFEEIESAGPSLEYLESAHLGHAEEDSSVDGLEWISMPATLEEWRGEFGALVRGGLADLQSVGLYADSPDCGQHIHVSRDAFDGRSHLARFVSFFSANPEFTLDLSGRADLDQWASVDSFSRPGSLRDKILMGGDRYCAVNLRPRATVEVRIWAGTDNFEDTLGAVEFLAALVEFTAGLTVGAVMIGALDASSFGAWLADSEQAARFPHALDLVRARTDALD